MTPFEIEILLHYYCSPTEHRAALENPPIWVRTRDWFLREELLSLRDKPSEYGATYQCTERGEAWIRHVTNLPLPVKSWVMP